MAAGRNRPAVRKARATPRPYPLRGLLVCGLRDRRMSGQHNHGAAYLLTLIVQQAVRDLDRPG